MQHEAIYALYNNVVSIIGVGSDAVAKDNKGNLVSWDATKVSAKQKELQTAERYGDQLRATLQKHNLTHLANKKPGMIEKRMQNATNRLWDCLADITNPDGVQSDAGTESSNCNKNSKNSSSNTSKTETSPTK